MYADAVTTVVLEVQSNPKAQKGQLNCQFSLCSFVGLHSNIYLWCGWLLL